MSQDLTGETAVVTGAARGRRAAEVAPDGLRVSMLAPGITLIGGVVDESWASGLSEPRDEMPMGRLRVLNAC